MNFQIKEIILWHRYAKYEPRRLRFSVGKTSIISGASRTGKSAVIPIIDYCLAANSCSIPVNTIRNACSWFGVIIHTDNGEILLARREPGHQKLTDDMFLLEDSVIENIPNELEKNTTARDVRQYLDNCAGLTNLRTESAEVGGSFDGRPSFRDLAAFSFQPQNVIANPEVLFFKTDRYEHREKLRRIFPYVLGVVTPELLAKQHELKSYQQELKRKERELKSSEEISSRWEAELKSIVSEAKELGLIHLSNVNLERFQMIEVLEKIVTKTDLTMQVTENTISDAISELRELEDEETKISSELTAARRRLQEMDRIRESATKYQEGLVKQRDRLKISEWMGAHSEEGSDCPVCGSFMEGSFNKLKKMQESLKELEQEAGTAFEIPAAFERELINVKKDATQLSEQLKAINIRKAALSNRSNEAKQQQYKADRVQRFIGNLERALQLHRSLGGDNGLRKEVKVLRDLCADLEKALRNQNINQRKRRALGIVNNNAGKILPMLDIERPDDPISLEIDDLSLKVLGENREDYLSEIGSGSNWLGYHVAVMLGLHEYFLSLDHSPVPSFLVIDQPSQVYFPRKLSIRPNEIPEEPRWKDEDIDAVFKVYKAFSEMVLKAKGAFQIIVLDHAPSNVWGNCRYTESSEEWRDGKKLVPEEWLDHQKP